jgi:lipopolysaccharide biosynthesis regulator YciM
MKLTDREIELLDGMIRSELNHAERCDALQNRTMAEKQKGFDMERVELLKKLRGFHLSRDYMVSCDKCGARHMNGWRCPNCCP